MTFSELGLSNEVLTALNDMGFSEPTPIQAQSIPIALEGSDLIGQAQTGTGKTAAFGIPLVERINLDEKHVQALVLSPTRELAVQIAKAQSIQIITVLYRIFNAKLSTWPSLGYHFFVPLFFLFYINFNFGFNF